MKVSICLVVAAMLSVSCAAHRPQVRSATQKRQGSQGASGTLAMTLESSDEKLRNAVFELAAVPSAAAHRRVAFEYRRLGVLDTAFQHFASAVKIDPTDAVSYDALARIWRDWGTPTLALGDARRAVFYAPRSAAAANTLGTVFQALGEMSEAKRWYSRAIGLDKGAWYALNNLCYVGIMTREPYAIETCRSAVAAVTAANPEGTIASNNLALAHAAAGDLPGARQWFRRAGDVAGADYRYGVLMMSTHAYREAEAAFQSALAADPEFTLAAARARQARLAAAAGE